MFDRLLDRDRAPSLAELESHCAENGARFGALNAYLSEAFQTSREIRFPYGKSYGWCVTHRRNKKLVCDVFAEAGAFTVMLRLSDAQFMARYGELGECARLCIDHRYPCGDGGWIHYRVTDDDGLADIKLLLSEKCARRGPGPKRSNEKTTGGG